MLENVEAGAEAGGHFPAYADSAAFHPHGRDPLLVTLCTVSRFVSWELLLCSLELQ